MELCIPGECSRRLRLSWPDYEMIVEADGIGGLGTDRTIYQIIIDLYFIIIIYTVIYTEILYCRIIRITRIIWRIIIELYIG